MITVLRQISVTKTVPFTMLNNDVVALVMHVLFLRDGPKGWQGCGGEGRSLRRFCRSSSFGAESAHHCVPVAKSHLGIYFMLHHFAALPLTSVKARSLQVEYSLLAENEGVKEFQNGFIHLLLTFFSFFWVFFCPLFQKRKRGWKKTFWVLLDSATVLTGRCLSLCLISRHSNPLKIPYFIR